MIKLDPPTQVKITVLPAVELPDYNVWGKLTKFAWNDLVHRSRVVVMSALNGFFYTEE